MPRRSSSGNGWPSDSGVDGSSPHKAEKNRKGSGPSRSGSDGSWYTTSGSSDLASGKSGCGKSKNGKGKKGTPPAIDVPTPGRGISPEEISGEAPEPPKNSPITDIIMAGTKRNYADPSVRPMGFMNGKAPEYASFICYRNAAITMLLNLPYFTNWLAGGYPSMREEDSPNTTMDTMQLLADNYWSQLNLIGNAGSLREAIDAKQERVDVTMDVLWQQFIRANPTFTPRPTKKNFYRQEDAALFLLTLLDAAFEELGLVSTNAKILGSMFRPWLASSTYCSGGCQTLRKRQEDQGRPLLNQPGWIHIVNFQNPLIGHEGERSFEECFYASLKQQQESDCPRCERLTWRTAKDKFVELPQILLTQLNRSTNTQGKIQERCEIPPELTVPVEDSDRNKYKNHKYRLAAVVAHSGESSKGGHYISYVRDPARTGSWIELDDDEVRNIDFEAINHNKKPGAERMLPYIMAWELIDLSKEVTAAGDAAEAANGVEEDWHDQQLEREAGLNAREKELDEKEEALERREQELDKKEKAIREENKALIQKGVTFWHHKQAKGKALDERESELEQRERRLQAEKEVDDLFKHSDNDDFINNHSSPPGQPEVQARDQIAQEVDERKDTATFCATFQNTDNHDESARAIFKLNNCNPNAPTKIESTVQLTDLEGNLRFIKKGTKVNEEFTIIFNVKGGKKRKREGDDQAGPRSPPPKKFKGPTEHEDKPQTSPTVHDEQQPSPKAKTGSPIKKAATTSPKTKKESKPPKVSKETSNKSPPPPPRRSTRTNKSKHSKIA